jgi:phosphoenolpyruvate synthase/pyruvate phosphate dikinase
MNLKKQEIINLKKEIRKLKWEPWLKRYFDPLLTSIFAEGFSRKCFESIGIKNMQGKAALFQNQGWYESKQVWESGEEQVMEYFKKHTMFDLTRSLNKFYKKNKKNIKKLAKKNKDPIKQFEKAFKILESCVAYIWFAHSIEALFNKQLKKEVPKYIKKDIDKFIGDASFPKKKNRCTIMEELIRKGKDPAKIAKEYGWIKARYDLVPPFTIKEIKQLKKDLKPLEKEKKVKIPRPLRKLFKEVQELVFYRTERTDVFYEFYFLIRPILKKVAKYYNIPYSQIGSYSAQSLINGNPKKYSKNYSYAFYEGKYYFGEEPILGEKSVEQVDEIKGTVAFKGIVKGKVKIVRKVTEINKVKKGDILVTQMTFPSFISAMAKASAFVTDEGGVTCHAAIVAREMRKPCIIGTKIATKVFKDGDLVEVDAEKGVVKKLK